MIRKHQSYRRDDKKKKARDMYKDERSVFRSFKAFPSLLRTLRNVFFSLASYSYYYIRFFTFLGFEFASPTATVKVVYDDHFVSAIDRKYKYNSGASRHRTYTNTTYNDLKLECNGVCQKKKTSYNYSN